jgi:hypothetical protein
MVRGRRLTRSSTHEVRDLLRCMRHLGLLPNSARPLYGLIAADFSFQ